MPRARAAFGVGAALFATAALFGSPGLYPPAIALAALPVLAYLWVRLAAAGLRLERRPPGEPLLEGRGYPFELRIRRGLRLPPLPPTLLRDPLLDEPLEPGRLDRDGRIPVEARFRRRGRIALGRAELELSDPFRLVTFRRSSADGGEVVVLPRIESLHFSDPAAAGRGLGLGDRGFDGSGPDSWAAEFEIDGLRPYRDGSPAARIHWPTVARTDELHERRITSGADAARLVILDPQRPPGEEQLDAAVRAAASICHELASGPGCTLLIGGEPLPIEVESRLRNFGAVHRRLAVAEADGGEPPTHRVGRAGIAIWVSSDPSRAPEGRLRRLLAARRLLVRPGADDVERAPGAPAPTFRVAGCEAFELGARARGSRGGVAA